MALELFRLSDYTIAGRIGAGATSRVFEATHVQTGREVAIKMLEPSSRGSHELRKRLEREARVLAGVRSAHVGRLLGVGWDAKQPFLVLERLRGETLADVIKREKTVPAHWLADWIEQLLLGVRDIHANGVIHRDIKPANIFLVTNGVDMTSAKMRPDQVLLKLIDFGVARLKEIALDGASLTSTHHLIGSMGYMAPEQLQSAKGVGPQADLYAVGVVLFRSLTGRLPIMARTFEGVHRLKVHSDAPRLSKVLGPELNPLLDEFVAKALARDTLVRFASAKEMLEAWSRVAWSMERNLPVSSEPIAEYDVEFEDSSTMLEYEQTSRSEPDEFDLGSATDECMALPEFEDGSTRPPPVAMTVRAPTSREE